jgi:four helix bundle protein
VEKTVKGERQVEVADSFRDLRVYQFARAALGEADETRSWLDDALDCGYLDVDTNYRTMEEEAEPLG